MSSDNDVEKDGSSAVINKTDDGDRAASFSSRARSYSSDTWCGPFRQAGNTGIRQDGHSNGAGGEHAAGRSPRQLRLSIDSRERGRDSLQHPHHVSMAESRDSIHSEPARITENDQTPLPRQIQRLLHLDRDNPGDWAVNHHLPNLITRLDQPEANVIGSALNEMTTKIREIRCGKKAEPTPSLSAYSFSEDGMRFRISFAEVQRMRIRKLQCQLVRHVVKMRLEGHESPGWEQTIKEYIKALKDHDYMENRPKSSRDPFLATGEYGVDNYVLNCNIDSVLANDNNDYVDSLKT